MTTSSRQLVPASQHPHPGGNNQVLGFSVNLDSGRGLLSTRHRRIGPLIVDKLSLEIPHLAFPFDVSGGAARFRHRRCALVHLSMHIDATDLTACFSDHELETQGFRRLAASVADGQILLAGNFCHQEHQADFTCRVAPVVQSGREVHFVFFDTRVYGFLPIPGAHLTRYLWRALRWPAWIDELPAAWRLKPVDAFARELLPRGGWKIPGMQLLHALHVNAARGQLSASCGEFEHPAVAAEDMPKDALVAVDGIAFHAAAEAALHEGRPDHAYLSLRRALDDGHGGFWAAERLLHLGAALPQFAVDSRKYAQKFLEEGTHPVSARLALAALAVHSGNQAAAAVHFAALAQQAQAQEQYQDAAAAWLAQSRHQADIDLEGALQAGNAAVGIMPNHAAGHAHMHRLHRRVGDLEQAGAAAERWAHHCDKSPESAALFCEFGDFFRLQAGEADKARRMYEHALARMPDFPPALQGLAELHLDKGDTSQAVTFFARLAAFWEQSEQSDRAIACHLRLADIWQNRLGDTASAVARYNRVIELNPGCLQAVVTLADMARAAGDTERALTHYQTVIAADTAGPDAAPEQAVHAYEQAIKILQEKGDDEQHVAAQLAYLDRLIALRPAHAEARVMRLGLLRAHKHHDRLVAALAAQARDIVDPDIACDSLMEAAHIAQNALQDPIRLRRLLEAACKLRPARDDVMDMFLPLLSEAEDWVCLAEVASAAGAAAQGAVRARYWVALARAQAMLEKPVAERVATLRRAIAASPTDVPACQALVDTLASDPRSNPGEVALACEALAGVLPAAGDQARAWMASARHRRSGLLAVAAAERAVALAPQSPAAHFLLLDVLEAGDDPKALPAVFDAAARQLGLAGDLAELWNRQVRWAKKHDVTALRLQGLQGLAGMHRLTPDQASDFVMTLHAIGQVNRAVIRLEEWADAGAPLHPSEALLMAAEMLQAASEYDRAHAMLERVLKHAKPYAGQAAQALEGLAKLTHHQAWLVQAWRAHIAHATDPELRAIKQGNLLNYQTENNDPERLDTARALLETQPSHPLACCILAAWHDAEKQWGAGLDLRLTMLEAPPDPGHAERRRATYVRAASVAADLRPAALKNLHAAFAVEYPTGKLTYEPLSERLTAQEQWADLLALRREQHRREPENLRWQRAIATLLQDHADRPHEARNMWRAICAADPLDAESLAHWLKSAERTADVASVAAAHAACARQTSNPDAAWEHALTAARLQTGSLRDPAAARTLLQACLDTLGRPQDVTALVTALTDLSMHEAVLDLAPGNWLHTANSPEWTERIEHALKATGKHFEYVAFVLQQTGLGTIEAGRATVRLAELICRCPPAKLLPQMALIARARAFCAEHLEAADPEAALEHCRAALPHHPAPGTLVDMCERLLVATHRAAQAADFRLAQARRAGLGADARRHFEALADLCEKHLENPGRTRWALEQALHHAPQDPHLLRRLVDLIPLPQERPAFVTTAEALLAVSTESRHDTALLQKLATACSDSDRPRAIDLLRQAMAVSPDNADIRDQWRALCGATGAPAADTTRAEAPRPGLGAADAILQSIADWEAAVAREPDNQAYRERYAAACAQSREHLPTARAQYIALLQRDCTQTPWLRVLARLEGAMNNSPAAYAFYAALLAVSPGDVEAQRFVTACRQLRTSLPARPFTNRDWHHIRADFVPRATHPQTGAELADAIEPQALGALAPKEPKLANLTALLNYLGIPIPSFFLWPAGGRQCALGNSSPKPLMLGAALYSDMPHQAGMFMSLRAILQAHDAEIHPAHGNNAALLLTADVAEAIEALCAARGLTLAPHASRAALIKKSPELSDLLRFAESPAYLQLRRELN